MSVNCYEWVVCDEYVCYCDVVESVEGDMVDYEDYVVFEVRCLVLVVENVGLKSIQEWVVVDVFKIGVKWFELIKVVGFDIDDCLYDVVFVMFFEL